MKHSFNHPVTRRVPVKTLRPLHYVTIRDVGYTHRYCSIIYCLGYLYNTSIKKEGPSKNI